MATQSQMLPREKWWNENSFSITGWWQGSTYVPIWTPIEKKQVSFKMYNSTVVHPLCSGMISQYPFRLLNMRNQDRDLVGDINRMLLRKQTLSPPIRTDASETQSRWNTLIFYHSQKYTFTVENHKRYKEIVCYN